MSRKQVNNKLPLRYIVTFPGYNPQDEEMCQNFSSYNANLSMPTSPLGMAFDSARRYDGQVFVDYGDEIIPYKSESKE